MLDLNFIRENPDLVKESSLNKGYEIDIDYFLKLDTERKKLLTTLESVRAERNRLADSLKSKKPNSNEIQLGRDLKERLNSLEAEFTTKDEEFKKIYKAIPNIANKTVPKGKDEDENQIYKVVGKPRTFSFPPKSHYEIAQKNRWIDKERASKVTGSRFAYIQGELALLQIALMQWTMNTLSSVDFISSIIEKNSLALAPKPFCPVFPPFMIRTEVFDNMDRLEPREERYKIEGEDLWLQGSAEHVLGSMYSNEIIEESSLPIRMVGYATSFRREAGSYGKDVEGIIRMHQFDKLEMEIICSPESGQDEHNLMVCIQEYLMQALGLPYRVMLKCTGDIGKPNACGIDIDVWLPSQEKYRETHTADYMTDYQTRRLNTRIKRSDGTLEFAHTNDATAFALGRILVAIIENYQDIDGKVSIPEVLKPHFFNKKSIG
jgi:seryl-tRNA synthetase